jgi:methionyl-tRNA formyltransferase
VLCDDIRDGLRIARAVDRVEDISLRVLVANGAGRRKRIFFAALVRGVAVAPLSVFRLATSGRLRVSPRKLDDPRLVGKIHAHVGLHAAGTIYRRIVLDRFSIGILNAHIGVLPKYRGRSVLEWSLLNGDDTGISVFLIDDGIDTGPIILVRKVPIPSDCTDVDAAKSHLFSLDGESYAAALELLRGGHCAPIVQLPQDGTRYYKMSSLFSDVVTRLLTTRAYAGSADT